MKRALILVCLLLLGCPPPPDIPQYMPDSLVPWQEIGGSNRAHVQRTRTPTGWLVIMSGYDHGGITFVPDPDGTWAPTPVEGK